jgi:prepilin-type processing-associated H-X9-DG protein
MRLAITDERRALTLVDLLVAIAVVALLALVLVPALQRAKAKAGRICCTCNLKQIGLSFRIWAGDNKDRYPMRVFGTNGGTLEWVASGEVWPHFQVLSNELSTPYILVCSPDKNRTRAANFVHFGNSNISYFVGLDTDETEPQMFLSGDSNLEVDGKPVGPSLLNLWTNSALGWTAERHIRQGNVCLADGSVQQLSNAKLREQLAGSGVTTNRLAMP